MVRAHQPGLLIPATICRVLPKSSQDSCSISEFLCLAYLRQQIHCSLTDFFSADEEDGNKIT